MQLISKERNVITSLCCVLVAVTRRILSGLALLSRHCCCSSNQTEEGASPFKRNLLELRVFHIIDDLLLGSAAAAERSRWFRINQR